MKNLCSLRSRLLAIVVIVSLCVTFVTTVTWVYADDSSLKKDTVTMTQEELTKLINHHVTVALKGDSRTQYQKISSPENWTVTVYRGVEYVIYSGPGEIASARLQPLRLGARRPLPNEEKK